MSAACTIRIYGAMERQKQMSVQQLSVFIENRCGTLLEVTEVLAKEKIDIRALSLTETPEYGILRLIVSDTSRAFAAMRAAGKTVSVNDVLCIEIPDDPGGLMNALCILNNNDIDVEYMYTFVGCGGTNANVAIRVADNDLAARLLADAGYRLVSD